MKFEERKLANQEACAQGVQQAVDRFFQHDSVVSEAAQYSLLNGGKRVRGTLVLAVCEMLGGDCQAALWYAAAIEMIHAFSLIHDDLPCMDDDDLRRGKPSCHIAYGEANALLAGDLLSLEAFSCIAGAPLGAESRCAATQLLAFSAGARGMVYGQELDLAAEEGGVQTEEALAYIHAYKTVALLSCAAGLGVLAAGEKLENHAAIAKYSENIGYVFQIIDDILDTTATVEVLGKPIASDARNQKATYVSLLGAKASRDKAARLTLEAVDSLRGAYGAKADFLCAFANDLLSRAF